MRTILPFILLLVILNTKAISQDCKLIQLRNCQREMRTVTFSEQVTQFLYLVMGTSSFKQQKWIRFSSQYSVDTALLERQILKVQKTLPAGYFKTKSLCESWYDNQPDEKAIWFTLIFSNGDAKNLKIHSAIKILFTGDNASLDAHRSNPAVRDVQFILDPKQLTALAAHLKKMPEAGQ